MVSRDVEGLVADHRGVTATTASVRERRLPRLVDLWVGAGAVVIVLTLVAGLALHVANKGGPLAAGIIDWWAMPLVGGIAFGGAGLLLARVRPELPMGWLLAAIGVVLATSWTALEYGVRVLGAGDRTPAAVAAFWYANWAWATALVTIGTVVPLVLPEGR